MLWRLFISGGVCLVVGLLWVGRVIVMVYHSVMGSIPAGGDGGVRSGGGISSGFDRRCMVVGSVGEQWMGYFLPCVCWCLPGLYIR